MKRIGILILVLVLILSTAACGNTAKTDSLIVGDSKTQGSAANPSSETPKKKIALVMKTLTNPFFAEMEVGARRAEKELGIELIVKAGAKETSIDQQIAIVKELISEKVDAIVIAPGSSTDLIPVLKEAQEAHITIVNIDNRLDPALSKKIGLADIPFISVDNEKGAYISAKHISDMINKPTKAVILEGIQGADNGEKRKLGALRAFGENKNIEVVASETANWKIDEAYEVIKSLFRQYPDIGAVFCANDMMALGVVQYLEKSDHKNVLVAGFDALEEAKKSIKDGKLQVTIDQRADLQGYTGVKYAVQILSGQKQPLETMLDTTKVTSSSLQ